MIGFVGMGNMGYALLKGLLKSFPADELCFHCRTEEKMKAVSEETLVTAEPDNISVVRRSQIIILAVKPQMYADIFAELEGKEWEEGKIFVSLAPGKTMEYIRNSLGKSSRIVRAMPNTPALIGCGMTGVALNKEELSEEEFAIVDRIFSSVGKYELVSEEQISAVICASGSSPAYVYMFIDQLAMSAAGKGLDAMSARRMAAEAVLGAARMVIETGEEPQRLKEKVCSKGGTTLAGIEKLEDNGFCEAIWAATDACYKRAEELAAN